MKATAPQPIHSERAAIELLALRAVGPALCLIAARAGLIATARLVRSLSSIGLLVLLIAALRLVLLTWILLALTLLAGRRALVSARLSGLVALARLTCLAAILLGLILLFSVPLVLGICLPRLLWGIAILVCHHGLLF